MAKITVKAENLSIGYDNRMVCEHMSFTAEEGKIVCLMGANGAGKSTLLKTLAGLLPVRSGEILLLDKNMNTYRRGELSKVISVVLTERISVDFLTALEVTYMGRYPHTGFMGKLSESDKSVCEDCLNKVNAAHLKNRIFATLSDGEKQKVLIARAIAQEPSILLLDEPTTHLDIKHKLETMNLLNALAHEKKMTVILSLHELDLAIKACHKIISIKDGGIVYTGTPENMDNGDQINELFNMDANSFSHITGSVEMRVDASTDIFVTTCGGKGTNVYRVLAKNRMGFTTGIIAYNDTDYHIVKSMGANVIALEAFEKVNLELIEKAQQAIDQSKLFIDTGFTVNAQTKYNKDLIIYALNNQKKILSMRDQVEFCKIFGKGDVFFTDDISNLDWEKIY